MKKIHFLLQFNNIFFVKAFLLRLFFKTFGLPFVRAGQTESGSLKALAPIVRLLTHLIKQSRTIHDFERIQRSHQNHLAQGHAPLITGIERATNSDGSDHRDEQI